MYRAEAASIKHCSTDDHLRRTNSNCWPGDNRNPDNQLVTTAKRFWLPLLLYAVFGIALSMGWFGRQILEAIGA